MKMGANFLLQRPNFFYFDRLILKGVGNTVQGVGARLCRAARSHLATPLLTFHRYNREQAIVMLVLDVGRQ